MDPSEKSVLKMSSAVWIILFSSSQRMACTTTQHPTRATLSASRITAACLDLSPRVSRVQVQGRAAFAGEFGAEELDCRWDGCLLDGLTLDSLAFSRCFSKVTGGEPPPLGGCVLRYCLLTGEAVRGLSGDSEPVTAFLPRRGDLASLKESWDAP
jgi:hypothetical protein